MYVCMYIYLHACVHYAQAKVDYQKAKKKVTWPHKDEVLAEDESLL